MVTPNKQPGVYITENTAFPNSIVEVATAVPAFIGYTEKAEYKGQDLRNKPWRIDSMTEYIACFGGPPSITFRVTETAQSGETKAFTANLSSSGGRVIGQDYYVHPSTEPNQWFLLYASMALFFLDGGGTCYIVSVGSYDKVIRGRRPDEWN